MNKATKGAMAAGAAALLLLGGAGSLALWSDEETVVGGDINTGTLDITAEPGTWTDISDGEPGSSIPIIGVFRMVPGDTIRYTTEMNVTAIGDNLAADIVVDAAGLPTVGEGPDTARIVATDIGTVVRDAGAFTVTTTATDAAGAPIARISDANDGDVINVNAVITFDDDNQDNVNTTVSFEDFNITVTQVRL
jgi:alternate signal-mediated exported protein